MTSHASKRRRYRKSQGRRVWVFSELNRDLRPEQIARIITAAGLEQARLEADARADEQARHQTADVRTTEEEASND